MKIIKFIPNLFTLGNLALGVLGIWLILTEPTKIEWVSYMILGAAILDFLDGFMAKILKAQSPIGAQLDSLADLVTFGVLPGFIYWTLSPQITWNWVLLLVPLCAAYRLAKFNVNDDQGEAFKGISTTAHGLFAATIPFFIKNPTNGLDAWLSQELVLTCMAIFFSILMVSDLRMISLKFKNTSFNENWDRYALLLLSAVFIALFSWSSAPLIMMLYLSLSLYGHIKKS